MISERRDKKTTYYLNGSGKLENPLPSPHFLLM